MPWVNIVVSAPCSRETQNKIKTSLGKILAETMNKPEQGLTVTFTATFAFYRGGTACNDAVVVDMRYIGEFPLEVKREVTRRTAGLLAETLGVDPLKVSVLMSEVRSDNWGRKAGDY